MNAATAAPAVPRTRLRVRGMTCGNCSRKVTSVLQSLPGVRAVSVSLEDAQAVVRWQATATPDLSAVLAALTGAGYPGEEISAADAATRQRGWQLNLWIGVGGAAPLLLGEWVFGWGGQAWFAWLSFGLGSVVQFVAGAPFYRGAWAQLRAGASSMDTLVALGSSTAYGFSVWLLFSGAGHHFFFAEAAAIIALISVGHWLEARASVRASSALQALLQLAPATAVRLAPDGSEKAVPVAQLQPGDRVRLRPGDRVPVDGVVVDGGSAVEEAMLTGESLPVDKGPGDALYTGTLSQSGQLVLRVTATGDATALAAIIEAVERAQSSRANVQRLADRVSNVFVPVIVGVALLTGLWWGLAPESALAAHAWLGKFLWPMHLPDTALARAVLAAASVLIVACPCALGLATPAALMAGANAAARRGILIRDGVALEKAGRITTVLLDKTGTLTTGKPVVAAEWDGGATPEAGYRLLDARSLAAALARGSNHPLSRAVAELAQREIPLDEWREIRGQGVQARLLVARPASDPDDDAKQDELRVRLGALRWLGGLGVEVAPAAAFADTWSAKGASVLGIAVDRRLVGALAVQDALKPQAAAVLSQLRARGLRLRLVSGDHPAAAAEVARQVGLNPEEVFAEVRPEQKAGLVRELQQRGERVAFIGDGINDAPALQQADLGIAVSRASDVAREAADVILLNPDLAAVPEALGLAQATLRTIRQNLFWAFFYNVAAVPLAATGFLSPVVCAAAMGLSDLIVIGNALRLRRRGGGAGRGGRVEALKR
jgi:Cu+-exporting ATPase